MAGRRKRTKEREPWFDDLEPHTKQAILAVFFVVLGIYFVLSLFGYAGMIGNYTNLSLDFLLGGGAYLAPVICAFYVYALMNPKEDQKVSLSKIIGIALLFLALLGFLELYQEDFGGLIGLSVKAPLFLLMGSIATGVIISAFLLIGIFLTFNIGLHLPKSTKEAEENAVLEEDPDIDEPVLIAEAVAQDGDDLEEQSTEGTDGAETKEKKSLGERLGISKGDFVVTSFKGPYDPPPLSLLQGDKGKGKSGDAKASSNIIKRTLKNFGIDVEMDEVKTGPTVTQYSLKPAEGVRISRIVGLQGDLELALAAHPIRIEAPIPGKSLVGIEVPNSQKQQIGLASLLSSPEYTDSPKPLLVALGKDIPGTAHFANVAKMPHCLIAGTTGSGKSVMIHTIITSLLFRNSPEQLRFFMVDPKLVELTAYNGIPHLLAPVITDVKKTILMLKWAIKEMERRYEILQAEKVRDIESYHLGVYQPSVKNKKGSEDKGDVAEPLPYIVIVIDELADLMSANPRELEACIVRLTQKSRAIGIHLIIATQRPEVKVITGLIKANMPTRLALKVNSLIDSRTIIDQSGAEKLLGSGDLLFVSQESSKPKRLQSPLITDSEMQKVVEYLKNQAEAHELDSINLEGNASGDSSPDAFFDSVEDGDKKDDDLYEDAKAAVLEGNRASTSYLQRKLRIGYSRAAGLMDLLEERGIIGPQDGARPRDILVGGGENNNPEEEN